MDLQLSASCLEAAQGVDAVFQLAADMGGMGFIENNKALCMLTVLTSTHMLVAARECRSQALLLLLFGLRLQRRQAEELRSGCR